MLFGQITALDDTWINDPNYNIGYGYNVTSNSVACNLGNYSVELEYVVTVHNSGSPRVIDYYMKGVGDYVIDSNGTLKNKGEETENWMKIDSFSVPSGTSMFVFRTVLPTANAAGIFNKFVLKY
jgi:hypothetical protein